MRVVSAALLLGIALVGACSGTTTGADDGAGGEDSTPTVSPVRKCETYASTWCKKAFGCYVKVGRLDEGSRQYNIDECTQLIIDALPCSGVMSASSSYDTCITQINGMSCAKWDVPKAQFGTVARPDSCEYALSFE